MPRYSNLKMRNCATCGNLFGARMVNGNRATTCSPECKVADNTRKWTCKNCNAEFDSRKRSGEWTKFCSKACFEVYRTTWGKEPQDSRCMNCGKSKSIRSSRLFCSKGCREEFFKDRDPMVCSECGDTKKAHEFPCVMRDGRLSIKSKCTKCTGKHSNFGRTKDRSNRNNLMYLYGLTQEQYDDMLARQHGKCALCGGEFVASDGRYGKGTKGLKPCVDHSHNDGHIRAIVHLNCNLGLGKFGDSVDKLAMALDYLKRYGE